MQEPLKTTYTPQEELELLVYGARARQARREEETARMLEQGTAISEAMINAFSIIEA